MAAEIVTKEDLQILKGELLQEIVALIGKNPPAQKEWLRSVDVRKLLSISPGTLQNLRISGALPYTKIGGTLYYAYVDVLQVLNKNKREAAK